MAEENKEKYSFVNRVQSFFGGKPAPPAPEIEEAPAHKKKIIGSFTERGVPQASPVFGPPSGVSVIPPERLARERKIAGLDFQGNPLSRPAPAVPRFPPAANPTAPVVSPTVPPANTGFGFGSLQAEGGPMTITPSMTTPERQDSTKIPGVMPTVPGESFENYGREQTQRAIATSIPGDAQYGNNPAIAAPPEEPGTFSKIGAGLKNLLSDVSLPEGQKAHLTALAFGLGLLKGAGTYSPIPVTSAGVIGEAGLGALQLYMHMDESEKSTALKNAQFARQLAHDQQLVENVREANRIKESGQKETSRHNLAIENAPQSSVETIIDTDPNSPTFNQPVKKVIDKKQLGVLGPEPVTPVLTEGQFGNVRGKAPVSPYTGKQVGEVTELTPGKPYELKIGNTISVFNQGRDGKWKSTDYPDMQSINTEEMRKFSERRQIIDREESSIHTTMKNISGLTESDLARIFSPDAKSTDAMAIMAKAHIGDKERDEYLRQIDKVRQKRSRLEAEITGKAPMGSLSKASNPASWE